MAKALPAGPVSVEFDDVRFAYPSAEKVSLASLEEVSVLDTRGGEEVLHGISFRVDPGQTVALVGSSGAGKSTIAQLLSRLYDVDSGAVRIGGIDVRDTTFASMRGTVGMALDWRDTGGSQFFITHSPAPHLDARYTVFGTVVDGMDVVDRLLPWDVIRRVRIRDGVNPE